MVDNNTKGGEVIESVTIPSPKFKIGDIVSYEDDDEIFALKVCATIYNKKDKRYGYILYGCGVTIKEDKLSIYEE